jgi:apolipoprotein N-acyltransferase
LLGSLNLAVSKAKKEKNGAATAIGCLGALVGVGCVIVGFVWCVRIIVDRWGVPMGGIAVLVFPATLAIMPWYAGLRIRQLVADSSCMGWRFSRANF